MSVADQVLQGGAAATTSLQLHPFRQRAPDVRSQAAGAAASQTGPGRARKALHDQHVQSDTDASATGLQALSVSQRWRVHQARAETTVRMA